MYCVELLQYVVRIKTAVRGVHSGGGDIGAQPPLDPWNLRIPQVFQAPTTADFTVLFIIENFPIWPIKHIFFCRFSFIFFFVGMLYEQNKKVEKLLNYRLLNKCLNSKKEFISPWLARGEWGCIGCRDYGNKMKAYLS